MDKARATAARIAGLSPGEGYQAQAKLAEKRKEYDTAEIALRRAVETAPRLSADLSSWRGFWRGRALPRIRSEPGARGKAGSR